ncbi:MAG TPA: ATP-binding cassette domain-containing protein [Streptosporangiaceae bacterium]|nr:ATP-binding cassette domain-containing protein [Streptosporangiaceae bacterium]
MLEADIEVQRRDFNVKVALAVAPGERLALFGPSGAGKTTVLESIAGLVPLRHGRVALAGRVLSQTSPPRQAVPPWQRRVGLLRQDPALFPHLSVHRNLAYGAGRHASAEQTMSLAAELGIGGLLGEPPSHLSGGQAHRVALGRLLLARCEALLLDEPYTGLDAGLRRTLADLVATLVSQRAVPTVLVTHDLAEAQAFADRITVLDQGRVLQDGPSGEVVRAPATRRVAELAGYRSFVPLPGEGSVAVHPERVVQGAQPERGRVLTGQVRTCRPAGPGWEVELLVDDVPVWCKVMDPLAGEAAVTVVDAPCFGPDGVAVPSARSRA